MDVKQEPIEPSTNSPLGADSDQQGMRALATSLPTLAAQVIAMAQKVADTLRKQEAKSEEAKSEESDEATGSFGVVDVVDLDVNMAAPPTGKIRPCSKSLMFPKPSPPVKAKAMPNKRSMSVSSVLSVNTVATSAARAPSTSSAAGRLPVARKSASGSGGFRPVPFVPAPRSSSLASVPFVNRHTGPQQDPRVSDSFFSNSGNYQDSGPHSHF
jgi:hypothetical protein